MASDYEYKGLYYRLECSNKPQSNGRYRAKLYYESLGLFKIATASTLDKLMHRIETKTAPLLHSEVLPLLEQQYSAMEGEITLPIFWALWQDRIFEELGLKRPNTVSQRESLMKRMLGYLGNIPLISLNLEHITTAAAQAAMMDGNATTIEGANNEQKISYRNIIRMTSAVLDKACMEEYFDENFLREYADGLKKPKEETHHIFDAYRQENLCPEIQIKLYERICKDLGKEGLMFGIALMLFAGLRAEEACALQFEDVKSLYWMDPGMPIYILGVSKIRNDSSNNNKESAELVSYRCIPMHKQLASLFIQLKANTEQELSRTKNLSLDSTYLVRPGKRIKGAATPKLLNKLTTSLLKEYGVKPPPEIQGADSGTLAFQPEYSYLLRRNFKYRLELDVGMTADELNHLLGRDVVTTDSKHYRDWATDACMINLKTKLDRWHIPSLQPYQMDVVATETGLAIADTGHDSVNLDCTVTADIDGYYELVIRSKRGADISARLIEGGVVNA